MTNIQAKGVFVGHNPPAQNTAQTGLPNLQGKDSTEIATAMWSVQPQLINAIGNVHKVYSTKYGMFASVPIVCRGDHCAYKDICMVSPTERIEGIRCPMEIATILARYEQWCAHFDIDTSHDEIDVRDLVDATLIKDLVNVEVQMLRVENKIALNGDFMVDTLLDIDRKCTPYYGKAVSPEAEFLMSLYNQKIKILNQLNATRKDKATDKSQNAASDMAIRIFQQIKDMETTSKAVNISDVEFDDFDDSSMELPSSTSSGGESNGNGE